MTTPPTTSSGPAAHLFATGVFDEPVNLMIPCPGLPAQEDDAGLQVEPTGLATLKRVGIGAESCLLVTMAKLDAGEDAEQEFCVKSGPAGDVVCRVVLRRTRCVINDALVRPEPSSPPLHPEMIAGVLWHSWRRFSEVVGLKRFTSGLGGSDVVVFRPRLSRPPALDPSFAGPDVPDVFNSSWGSPLLAKTGPACKVREEWNRFRVFLADRVHPFMSRSENLYSVSLAETGSLPQAGGPPRATIIGSFLGGDLLRAEALENVILGGASAELLDRLVARVFLVLSPWHTGGQVAPLKKWWKMWHPGPKDASPSECKLFGKFDFTREADRERFRAPLMWDVAFGKEAHLHHHLLGRKRDGLIHRLLELEVQFSVIHGDLHPRNVLADPNDVWFLDFGETTVAPTLFDFAKLEIYARLWCLELKPEAHNFGDNVMQLERLLIDNFTDTEATLEPIRRIASHLGASSEDLLRLCRVITSIRRHAVRFSNGAPDRRDYLAVLYLTALNTLRYAGTDTASPDNFRLVTALCWQVEDILSRMTGMEPFA
ncbi:MAG TPA: phosphotransferase, partial [Verrucomicrobiae bacterium]|nr:phosphotransferase [Verrucomicrobiae bacterium]